MASSYPSEQDIPPLLALPTELKLQIIAYLSQDTSPNLAYLRRTHTSFLNVIPKSDVRLKSSRFLLRSQLLAAEVNHRYLLPLNHYPCYKCTAVLHRRMFNPGSIHLVFPVYERWCRRCDTSGMVTTEGIRWEEVGREQLALYRRRAQRKYFQTAPLPLDEYWQ